MSNTQKYLVGDNIVLCEMDVDSKTLRQLFAYIKQDKSLCRYCHVIYKWIDPGIDRGEVQYREVDGDLVEVKF